MPSSRPSSRRAPAEVVPISAQATAQVEARNVGIDALRAALTVLVVFHHAAIAYGASGSWFYRDPAPAGSGTALLLTVFCTLNQAFFMGLFFLLAGAMTPAALARRGTRAFLTERFLRLGIPLVVFAVLIGPLTDVLGGLGAGVPAGETLSRLARSGWLVPGPMWFVEALLILSVGYVVLRAVAGADRVEAARPFPSDRALAAAAVGVGAAAFLLRLRWPVGTSVLALQLGYCASYVVLFLAGCLGARGRWIERVPATTAARWLKLSLVAGLALPAVLVTLRAAGGDVEAASGGWSWLAAFYAFWEPLFAWGVNLSLLLGFQQRFATLGPAWSRLVRRAYLMFIVHPPVLVAVSLALTAVAAPAWAKFVVAGAVATALSYVLAGLLLAIPAVRRIA
ncbi:acyltransferase family protein [Alsobacter sp. R-9]